MKHMQLVEFTESLKQVSFYYNKDGYIRIYISIFEIAT